MSVRIAEYRVNFEKALEHFRTELGGLRTGRVNAALVEQVMVLAYGQPMQVKALGTIGVPDPKTLIIEPWDKGLLKDIEKALTEARVGANPVIDGGIIRLSFPSMTEESRKQVAKVMRQKYEEGRIGLRQMREDFRALIVKSEQAHEIGEDERFRMQKELDDLVKEYNEKLEVLADEKEQEILTV